MAFQADSWEARGSICINVISSPAGGELTFVDIFIKGSSPCGELVLVNDFAFNNDHSLPQGREQTREALLMTVRRRQGKNWCVWVQVKEISSLLYVGNIREVQPQVTIYPPPPHPPPPLLLAPLVCANVNQCGFINRVNSSHHKKWIRNGSSLSIGKVTYSGNKAKIKVPSIWPLNELSEQICYVTALIKVS